MKVLKAIIGGALFGAAFFFIPFIIMRIFLFALVLGFIFKLVRGRGGWGRGRFGGRGFGGGKQFAFADYIRGMSNEEYDRFRQHFGNDCRGGRRENETINETKID